MQKYIKRHTRVLIFLLILLLFNITLYSQSPADGFDKDYIEKTIKYLASDKLKGRVNHTIEQLEAAEFLAAEFASAGLEPFPGFSNYYVPFKTKFSLNSNEKLEWNDRKINDSLFYYMPAGIIPKAASLDDFMILRSDYPLADSLLFYNWKSGSKTLIWVVTPDSISFSEATANLVFPAGMPVSDILLVCDKEEPAKLKFKVKATESNGPLYNIVGMIPGDSLPDEAIIFSAHYDHVDRGMDFNETGIFNGANDDASGTTAVLALMNYYAGLKSNRRTIIFCLFAGEELGMLGSNAFVKLINPGNIKAVINIEMIGMTNASGKNAFNIIGGQYSNLPKILKQNLKGEKFSAIILSSDPQHLFERSDNYPFAQLGIPAHTIMCSDDSEPCYHRTCDDARRIDIDNMIGVIKHIIISATSLIRGTDTPQRIK